MLELDSKGMTCLCEKNLYKNRHFTLSWCDFQVPKCTKFKIWGSLRRSPRSPSWLGGGSLSAPQEPLPALGPSGFERRPFGPRTQPNPLAEILQIQPWLRAHGSLRPLHPQSQSRTG